MANGDGMELGELHRTGETKRIGKVEKALGFSLRLNRDGWRLGLAATNDRDDFQLIARLQHRRFPKLTVQNFAVILNGDQTWIKPHEVEKLWHRRLGWTSASFAVHGECNIGHGNQPKIMECG